MDIKTLLIVLLSVNLFLGFFTYLAKQKLNFPSGVNYWVASNFLLSASYFFVALRDISPDFLSIILANVLAITAYISRLYGFKKLFNLPLRLTSDYLFIATVVVFVGLISYFTYINSNISARIFVFSGFMGLIFLYTGILILQNKFRDIGALSKVTASVFFLAFIIISIRGFGWFLVPSAREIFSGSMYNSLTFFSAIFIDLMSSALFLLINYTKLNTQRLESEENYRFLTENISDVVWVFDLNEEKYSYLSPAVHHLLGYTVGEIKQQPLQHTYTKESAEKVLETFKTRSAKFVENPEYQQVYYDEFDRPHKNGSIVITETSSFYRKNKQTGHIEIVGVSRDISERKKAEEDLLKTKTILQEAEKISNIGSFEFDIAENEITLSEGWQKIHGVNERVLKTHDLMPIAHPDDREKIENAMDRAFNNIQPYDLEHKIIRQNDKEHRIIKTAGKVIMDKNNKPYKMYGFVDDITERKQAENELKFQNALLKTQQEVSPDGILVVDENDKIISYNQRFTEIWGIPDSIMATKSADKIMQTVLPKLKNQHVFTQQIHDLSQNRQSRSHEEISLTDGKILESFSFPLVSYDNEYFGRVWYYRDITERKKAEQILKDSEERLKQANLELTAAKEKVEESEIRFNVAIDGTEAGIWDWDMVNNTVTFSSQWKRMLGYSDDEIQNSFKDWKKLWHPDDTEYIEKAINDHLAGLTEKYEIVHRLRHKNGKWCWIMTRGKILKDEKSKPYRWVGTNIDISAQKETEEALKKANATKDKFISIIGHDLINPFSSLIGFSDLLIQYAEEYDRDTIKDFAKKINNTTNHTYNLLNNLLEWSRSQRDKIPFNPQETNLFLLTHETYMLLKNSLEVKQIRLDLDVSEDINVNVDEEMIKAVIRNLLSNAIKFTSVNGEIRISAKKNEKNLEFEVSDNGIGMRSETMNSLFKVGKTISHPGTENERGTGFGLLLCKEFIDKHEGKIWVESEIGKGSTFKFSLPLVIN